MFPAAQSSFRSLLPLSLFCLLSIPSVLQAQQPPSGGATLHASTRLITVDVTVTGKHDESIHGLTCADFELREAKVTQQLQHCEEHGDVNRDLKTAANLPQSLPPNVFSNDTTIPMPSTLDVILLDYLNTESSGQWKLGQEAKELIHNAPAGHRIAIFLLGEHLTLLSGFTDDLAALETARLQAARPTLSPSSGGDAYALPLATNKDASIASTGSIPQIVQEMAQLRNLNNSLLTLQAMEQINNYLAGLPGKKRLLWLSSGFPLTFSQNTLARGSASQETSVQNFDRVQAVGRDLAANRIAIYPINSDGVTVDFAGTAEHSGVGIQYNEGSVSSQSQQARDATIQNNGTMDNLAFFTGGKAFRGSNDLSGLVHRALNAGSDYYTLTYKPADSADDGKFRPFLITSNSPGAHLSYRSGYTTANAKAPRPPAEGPVPFPNLTAEMVTYSMQRGIPNSTSIAFLAEVSRPSTPQLTPASEHKRLPSRLSDIDYHVNPDDLTWTIDGDLRTADLKMLLVGYNDRTEVIFRDEHPFHLSMTNAEFEQIRPHGIHLRQTLPIPLTPNVYLRLGVLDRGSLRMGTLEIATSSLHLESHP